MSQRDANAPAGPSQGGTATTGAERSRSIRFGVALIVVAGASAGFAIAFRSALTLAMRQFGGAHDVVSAIQSLPISFRVVLPVGGGLLAGLLSLAARRYGKSHGVGDVMEAVALGRVRLSMRGTLLKSAASFCAIASGGSIGREGPLIQFGGACAQAVSARFSLPAAQTRRMIAAGVAAGFAAAYNTPFAAVLFMLEVVTGVVVLDAILPALIATAISTVLTRASVGEGPIYGERAFVMRSALELLAFAGLAVVTALVCVGFMRMLSWAEAGFKRIPLPAPLIAASGGLITGVCVAWLPDVAGNGYEPLNRLLDGGIMPDVVWLLLLLKIVATVSTVASGSPGGVFTPTLLVGGTVGFLYGWVCSQLGHVGPAGGYALVGMAAATAACTHAPLMAAVLVFELSGDYAVVLPLVLATALATTVSRRLRPQSIYAAELKRRGVSWELTFEGRRLLP